MWEHGNVCTCKEHAMHLAGNQCVNVLWISGFADYRKKFTENQIKRKTLDFRNNEYNE